MTMREYTDLWLQTYEIPFRKPSTVACYKRAIASLPESILSAEMAEIESLHLQCAINTQAMSYPRAAQLTYATLHVSMARAVQLHLLVNNPMDNCEKPHHEAQRTRILHQQQLQEYQAEARKSDCWPLLMLIAALGLRRSEALGVCWSDITDGVLHVQHQRLRTNGKYELTALKSKTSDRYLKLAPPLQDELNKWPMRTMTGYIADVTPEHLTRVHNKAIRNAELPHVTLHGLRHSMATALVATGTPIKILQAILGHSTYKVTADLYANHVQDAQYTAEDLERMCRLIL